MGRSDEARPSSGERSRFRRLERIFRDSENRQLRELPIRLTARGIWVPTPLSVLAALLRITTTRSLFRSTRSGANVVVDAGTGDGRVLAALACFQDELDLLGVECDEQLFHLATENVKRLEREKLAGRPGRIQLQRGDYRRAATYESAGIRMGDVAVVVNYPDGNHEDLERLVIEEAAPGTLLCLLTHDPELRLRKLALVTVEPVFAADSSPWSWSVYSAGGLASEDKG